MYILDNSFYLYMLNALSFPLFLSLSFSLSLYIYGSCSFSMLLWAHIFNIIYFMYHLKYEKDISIH